VHFAEKFEDHAIKEAVIIIVAIAVLSTEGAICNSHLFQMHL